MKNPISFLCTILILFFIHKITLTQESWTPTSVNYAPTARGQHTAVWTGTKMIIWGGNGSNGNYKTGGLYDPLSNTWATVDSINSPSGRSGHTAIWTGSKMLIWGGFGPNYQRTGGAYNPAMNSWSSIDTANAPSARRWHTAIWTGSKMLIWGGQGSSGSVNTGGIYDPVLNSWTIMSSSNAPSPRYHHTAVWTGSKMIVWGGDSTGLSTLKTGGVYNPATDTWTTTSLSNCPVERSMHTAIWTGDKMIIWGGHNSSSGYLFTGGRYDPAADGWAPTSEIDVPTGRWNHSAIWSECKMVIWGGGNGSGSNYLLNSGGIYNPVNDSWDSTTTSGAPAARSYHTAVWTGSAMIIWGGTNVNYLNTGGKYTNPTLVGIGVAIGKIPSVSFLHQNYPNPFNPVTTISYGLPHYMKVKINLYDLLGKLVKELINEYKPAGFYEITFDLTNFTSGVYFYKIEAGTFIDTKKMVLIK